MVILKIYTHLAGIGNGREREKQEIIANIKALEHNNLYYIVNSRSMD